MRIATVTAVCVVAAGSLIASPASAAGSDFSFVEAVAPGAELTVIASAGDNIGGYLLPGIMDGIGVLPDGDDYVVLVNHELSAANKVAAAAKRAGGAATGATISAVNVDGETMAVTGASELLKSIAWYDYSTNLYSTTKPVGPAGSAAKDEFGTPNHSTALNRFCSAYLAAPGELAFSEGGKTLGYTGPVFFTGEEGSDESRAFAVTNTGQAVQLPRAGLAAWENLIVVPTRSKVTALMGMEDGSATDSQLWMYSGEKTDAGSWDDKAGLSNGHPYVMKIDGIANDNDFRKAYGKGKAAPISFKEIDWQKSGAAQNQAARALGTVLARVEDGAFDPKNPNDFYFVTTESNKDPKATAPNPATPTVTRDGGALWKLTFTDVKNPLAGGTISMLLDGSEAPYLSKPDNLTVDGSGNVLIQEDPGNNAHIARMVAYRIADGKIATVTKFKDLYAKPGAAQFITQDEESSGVVDVTNLMRTDANDTKNYYVFDSQIHVPAEKARLDLMTQPDRAADLVQAIEGGQIYVLTISDWNAVYGS
jgi:hypothetical protein